MAGLQSGEGRMMFDSVVWAQYIKQPRRHSNSQGLHKRRTRRAAKTSLGTYIPVGMAARTLPLIVQGRGTLDTAMSLRLTSSRAITNELFCG